jgi:glycosyltransferase involved in cell wall biosynthesis
MSGSGPSGRRALVCAPLPPEYDRESGSRRIYHLIEFLLEEGWTVAFVCENAPPASPHLEHLRQRGVATCVGFGGRTADLVEAGHFDLAIFAFWYLADRHAAMVRTLSPSTRILVESVDLHWLRNARRVLGAGQTGTGTLDASYGADVVGELNAYAHADGVLTVSPKEAALVNDVVGDPSLAHAVHDCDEVPPSVVPFEARRGILFVGNFRHPPNLDAVRWLCREVLPLLGQGLLNEHPLWIVGNGLDHRVRDAVGGLAPVRLVGWVPSLVPYLHAARVSVVPLRYGAGTKRKLIQALLARTPTVTTPIGIEGLDVADGRDLLVAADAPSFAAAIERLLTERSTWKRVALAGRRRMLASHGRAAARARLMEVVEEVLARPPKALADGDVATEAPEVAVADDVRRAVAEVVPTEAGVLVVSKGDPELVHLPGRRAHHFPRALDGRWAGYHPRDSRAAIEHLESLSDEAGFLVIPAPSRWWLDHYEAFAGHLRAVHETIWNDDSCVIYRLRPSGLEGRSGGSTRRITAEEAHALPSSGPANGGSPL